MMANPFQRNLRSVLPALLLAGMIGAVLLAASAVMLVRVAEDRDIASLMLIAGWVVMIALAISPRTTRGQTGATATIIVASLAMRFYAIHFVSGVALGADPMNYTNIAHAMLAGQGMTADDWRYGQDLRAYFPPFLPFLLTGWWFFFGDSALSTLVFNTLIDMASAWCLYDLVRRQADEKAGRIAALLFFAYPPFALSAPIPQKEALTILLAVLLLRVALIWMADRRGRLWRHALPLGALWALLALTQASLVLAPLAVALVLAAHRGFRPVLRLGLAAAPAFLVVIAPWWVRNWLLFGTFVPFTTASGFMRNVALGHYANPIPPDIFKLPEPVRSTIMAKATNARILQVPFGFLSETARALAGGFAFEEATIARFRHTTPPISLADRAVWTAPLQFAWVSLLGGALAGVGTEIRRGSSSLVTHISLALFIATLAVGMWFEFGERHRYILTPLLFMLAAGWFFRRLRRF